MHGPVLRLARARTIPSFLALAALLVLGLCFRRLPAGHAFFRQGVRILFLARSLYLEAKLLCALVGWLKCACQPAIVPRGCQLSESALTERTHTQRFHIAGGKRKSFVAICQRLCNRVLNGELGERTKFKQEKDKQGRHALASSGTAHGCGSMYSSPRACPAARLWPLYTFQ